MGNFSKVLSEALKPQSDAVTLGQVIDTLAGLDPDTIVGNGFGPADSWRGVYQYLAFRPENNVSVRSMLLEARSAVGRTYEGYKGGQFTMTRQTPCYIADYGDYGGDNDALTADRLAKMLDSPVVEARFSTMPERPQIVELHVNQHGEWGIFIEDEMWTAFKAYVCKLEEIAAKQEEGAHG